MRTPLTPMHATSPRHLRRVMLAVLTLAAAPVLRAEHVSDSARPAATHTGTLHGVTIWNADRIHRIAGEVRVAPGGVLRIAAGTRIEADAGASIVVDRTARIEAVGTIFEPVVLSCAPGAPIGRDCWDGLVIAGHAPVNGGAPDSPPARLTGVAGCAQRTDDALSGPFGGCDENDNSGVLRHVRVQYATRGLQLLGVGRGTQIEYVQVHGAGAGGVTVRGGTVDLRHLMITASGPTGISWRGGWVGRLQHAIIQLPAEGGVAVSGANDQAAPTLVPRSAPELYNVTAVRLPATSGAAPTTGVRLADGSGATLRNVLLAEFDVAFDVDGAASCALVGSAVIVEQSIIATTGAFGDPDTDADCTSATIEDVSVLGASSVVRLTEAGDIATLHKAAFSVGLPDFRSLSPLFSSTAVLPPANGFFLPSQFIGAVEPATVSGTNIPWYSGWTLGGAVDPINAFGTIAGAVTSVERGPLNGARVEAGGVSTLTAPDGSFTLSGVLVGTQTVAVATAPSGCTLPATASVLVSSGATSAASIVVPCTPATITTSGLVLTYICGNRFRVRNPNDAVVPVTWDVFGAGESGALSLPARPVGTGFSEIFFETIATGTVRLFYNGAQIQVKANGGMACAP